MHSSANPQTTFEIDPEGLDPEELVRRIPMTVPGGSLTDLRVVDGMVHITIPTANIEGVAGRLIDSGDEHLRTIAMLLRED